MHALRLRAFLDKRKPAPCYFDCAGGAYGHADRPKQGATWRHGEEEGWTLGGGGGQARLRELVRYSEPTGARGDRVAPDRCHYHSR